MEKQKFVNATISDADYQIIETVYKFHPAISDMEEVIGLYQDFGMLIFRDMFPRAEMNRTMQIQLSYEQERMKSIQNSIHDICNSELNYEQWIEIRKEEQKKAAPAPSYLFGHPITQEDYLRAMQKAHQSLSEQSALKQNEDVHDIQ